MSVGFRDWLARKMMQELVKVKQNQANIVKHLLGSVASQGLTYFTKLERLNCEDTSRNMERMRHVHNVRSDHGHSGHSSGYPTGQGPQVDSVYAKVTNVNNNANTPADNTGTPAKVPVYRIRSLPQRGDDDDTIMITTPTAELGPTGGLEVQQAASRSPRSPRSHSRQHAPLPPVPGEDMDSVYSLAQAVRPAKPPPYASAQHSSRGSRQNAPLPPPPSMAQVSPGHIKTERIVVNNDSAVSELEYDDEADDVYDDASSRTAPGPGSGEQWQQTAASHPPSPLIRKSVTTPQAPQPLDTRKNSPLPPLPPLSQMDSPATNEQTMFTKHVDSGTAAYANRASPKQQMLTGVHAQPSKQTLEANRLSVAPRTRRSRSRSPSPPSPAVPCRSPETKQKSTSSPPPPQVFEKVHTSAGSNSEIPEPVLRHSSHRPLVSTRGPKCYSTSQIPSSVFGNSDDVPPKPPPRKISAPIGSSHPPVSEENVSDAPGMPPVPPRKTSGGKPNMDPEAPPLPSRKVINTSESSSAAPHLFVHETPDTSETIAPLLPSREVMKDQGGSPGKKPTRRNASRTKSSESLTSLPEKEEKECHSLFTSLGEGIFSRGAMQRRLHGLLHAPSRNRATSNQFNSHARPRVEVGKRLSDPAESDKSHVPIHKTPLPPIPVQVHTSASAPQMVLEDVPQDVYEDLDKACELVNQDVPQFDYEDLDMQTDKPQDLYEDIDHETEDRPQEVYEDIDSEAAQRVSFAIDGTHMPQDYTPPIVRRSVVYPEEDEPQDYTVPIRRSGGLVELDEAQDYTPPIRRSRMYVDGGDADEEPQEYSAPVVRNSRNVIVDKQSVPSPPLPPRSASRESHDRRRGHRGPVTAVTPPPVSPASTKTQPDEPNQASYGQQMTRVSQPPPQVSIPPTTGRARSRSPVQPPVSRFHSEAPPPSPPKAPPQTTNVGPPAPPMGGAAPPPPPPPEIGFKASPPVTSPVHSREISSDISQEIDDEPPSELLSGIRNVQLKKAAERKPPPPQKTPPPVSSGSSTTSLFAEMQSFQLRKTKRPNVNTEPDTKPSQVDGSGGGSSQPAAPTVPFHAALRPTKSVGQIPPKPKPAPRNRPPVPVRPKPNKIPPPAIKPKPAHLLPPKQGTGTAHTSSTSPVHSNCHVHSMLKSRDRLGVPATS